jgi:hypothetical protein
MVEVRQSVLRFAASPVVRLGLAFVAGLIAGVTTADGQRFYPDDPLIDEVAPASLDEVTRRELNDYYDLLTHTLVDRGERQPPIGPPIRAQSVNTLDEAPNGPWFTNRIGSRPMSIAEVRAGPRRESGAPDQGGPWTIVGAKTSGVTPGFQILDARGDRYLLKFDPADHPEMATAADVIGSLIFHALGYHVPENYLVSFDRDDLVVSEEAATEDYLGVERPLSQLDINTALARIPQDEDGKIRAVASRFVPGSPIGEFRYYGTRSDDYNDTVPHEHRRELRGLHVFAAWVNHNDSRAINTLDSLIEEDGARHIRHFLIDFGATMGSASVVSNTARDGNAYFFEAGEALAQMLSLGAYVPWWARARYYTSEATGMLMVDPLEPEGWKPNYPNPAFLNRLPDDTFWAARKVMAFTDEHIRAIVEEGGYSDPEDEEAVIRYLTRRRDAIGRAYFSSVLPLDRFEVSSGDLTYVDLAEFYGFDEAEPVRVSWSTFDNDSEVHTPITGASTFALPELLASMGPGEYAAATIRSEVEPSKGVVVYLRTEGPGAGIMGIERTW